MLANFYNFYQQFVFPFIGKRFGMAKVLTKEEITHYKNKGYLYPLRLITAEKAQATRKRFEALESKLVGKFSGTHRTKFYLRYRWALELATTPRILDIVEDLIGPNILLYHNTTWFKNPADHGYVTWHQDITYLGHEPANVLSVWIALTPSNQESGCMQVLPGTHKEGPLPLTTPDLSKNNMLPSGQLVQFDTSSVTPVSMPLEPGEASIHHACTIHGSLPNCSTDRFRKSFICHYIPKQSTGYNKGYDPIVKLR